MDNTKLPDLDRLRNVKKNLAQLPPQESARDTSNWEDRNFSAPTLDTERRFEFYRDDESDIVLDPSIVNPYLLQEARKEKNSSKRSSSDTKQ